MEEERCQDVCGYIRSLIARGELHLGDRLPTERALSQASPGVSRGTVTPTACACWKAWRIGEPPGSGNYLSNNMGHYHSTVSAFMLLLGEIDYASINRMRRAIELQSFRIAVQACSPAQIQSLSGASRTRWSARAAPRPTRPSTPA